MFLREKLGGLPIAIANFDVYHENVVGWVEGRSVDTGRRKSEVALFDTVSEICIFISDKNSGAEHGVQIC
jgi:hypothetical protein